MSHRSTPLFAALGLVLVAGAWWWSTRATSVREPAAESALEPVASAATWLAGRVVLPAGTPADEHVEVLVAERDEQDEDARAFGVAADGAFRAQAPSSARSARILLRARYAFLRQPRFVDLGAEREPIVLEPELGGALRGRCSVPDGFTLASVAGLVATVRGRRLEIANRLTTESEHRTRVGDDGTFEIGGLSPDEQYTLHVARRTLAPFESGVLAVEPGRVRTIEVVLARGASVAGRIVDETGAPVEGCAVALIAPAAPPWFDGADATTDGDGRFRIEGAAPGKTIVRARKRGFLVTSAKPVTLAAGETTNDVEIALERGLALHGRVQWPDGSPAADASLALALGTDPGDQLARLGSAKPRTVKAASDGTFAFEGLTEGPFVLVASAESPAFGACSALVERVAPGAEPIAVALAPGHALSVVVKDDLGASVEDGSVDASFEHTAAIELEPALEATRTARGEFELRGLRAGHWRVRAQSGARSVERRASIPLDGGVIELVLPRPAYVAGTVRDADGRAASDATVSFRDLAKEMYSTAGPSTAKTDAQGRFRSPPLAPGRIAVQASSSERAPSASKTIALSAGETHAGVELSLRTGGTLAIAVRTAEGLADAGRRIDVVPMNVAGLVYASTFRTDEDGLVTISHVPAGSYQILTSPSAREMQDATGDDGLVDAARLASARLSETATVRDGVATHVALGGAEKR